MEKHTLIGELTQGKELTEQLKHHLNPASSLQTREFLVGKIISSYEKALSLLNCGASFDVHHNPNICISESMHPIHKRSPRSEIPDEDCKDQAQKNVFKKRKTQQRCTEQVKVCSGTGLDGPLDDGYSWRKYGQKDILGAKFPRGYYRCTHRHSQGCLAIKQVQRSDENPSIFEVTYRRRHTCVQASHSAMSNDNPKQNQGHPQLQQEKPHNKEKPIPTTMEEFLNSEGLIVKTENLDTGEEIFPSFSFLDALIDKHNEENSFVGSLSPTFISPATSESNYFSTSSCQFDTLGIGYNVQTPESELTEIGSVPTSVTNSPIGDFDFSNMDLETSFQFGNLELEFLA
ncbi:probable WRKY transcription factor 46 [Ricinus communis]|uniref:probable WRKY transcription factor 46 n=1 Tax=Ricinus communis TaxID=3988 RepID=UPI00201A361D|nr:probable WRKY transcription factor 46 [Ricinus communis]